MIYPGSTECRALGQIAQCFLQRPEPGLEVAPMINALGKYRLAHLLRARRLHAARICVEVQTLVLERQPAIVQLLQQLVLQVLHDSLVLHTMRPPWKDRIEVRHQVDVITVIAAEIDLIVGESLAVREVLFEA